MSEEEKKAIERAKFLIKIDTYLEKEMLTNLLNLIEKQSKETKELKDKIKAKIEELEKGNKNTFIRGEKILVLQSLLEK